MTKREAWECDNCGGIDTTENGEHIKICYVCNQDFCEDCQDEHAKDECGF